LPFRTKSRGRAALALSRRARFQIYFRPGGSAASGHAQSVDLERFADVATKGHLPDFP